MTKTLVAVSPPSPERNADQEPGPLEQQEPGGGAFGVIPQAGPDRELTAAEMAVIQQMVRQAKDAGVALTGPDGLLKGRITTTYVSTELVPWGVNAKGETYGAENANGTPDLIAVIATNGRVGYAYAETLNSAAGGDPSSPEEALANQKARRGKTFSVPVHESDGETVIGEFHIVG